MKTKVLIFLVLSAIITLSFSFVANSTTAEDLSVSDDDRSEVVEPLGGFVSER